MLVHPAILDATVSRAPDAEQHERIAAAVPDPSAHPDMASSQLDTDDVGRQRRKLLRDLHGELGADHLVRIEPHDPRRLDREVIEPPLELLGLRHELVLQDRRAFGSRDLDRPVRRVRVDDHEFDADGRDRVDRARDMTLLVERQDHDGQCGHRRGTS